MFLSKDKAVTFTVFIHKSDTYRFLRRFAWHNLLNIIDVTYSFIIIGENPVLEEVHLPNLTEVDNSIEIIQNTGLKIFSGLRELKTTPNVFVNQNERWEIIAGFDQSIQLADLTISMNPLLTEIKGFENLESTAIRIADNEKLTNFCTFSKAAAASKPVNSSVNCRKSCNSKFWHN